ncbi:MAG: phosphotransferase family protein [Acidimicrobiia bacterium]|nr:phosphotransferase family protein [Acidimicrobiia bacterium]
MTDDNAAVDGAGPPRTGEELDTGSLVPFLVRELGTADGPVEVEQFPSGHSNLTYLVHYGDRDLVIRRPPFGAHAKGGHDMGREFKVLSRLDGHYPLAPRPLAYDESGDVLGAPFYVMERIRGVILRREIPPGIDLTPEVMARLSANLIDNLADIHLLDWDGIGFGELHREGSYTERQVRGWAQRMEDSRTDPTPVFDEVTAWLVAERPADRGVALIHNDYKFDNIVLDTGDLGRIVGVLDWEMATVGDPLMDLGTTIGYWVEAGDNAAMQAGGFGPTMLEGCPTRRELVDRYAARTGFDCSAVEYYYVYALWKLAVVLQQIYYRYAKGFTTDERFAVFVHMVTLLSQVAADVIADPSRF